MGQAAEFMGWSDGGGTGGGDTFEFTYAPVFHINGGDSNVVRQIERVVESKKAACRGAKVKRIEAERVWRDDAGTVVHAEPLKFTPLTGRQVARIPEVADRVEFAGFEDE